MDTLGIFIKQPTAGRVKSRLGQEIGFENAAALYGAFLEDIMPRFSFSGDGRYLCYSPPQAEQFFELLAGNDYLIWQQPAGDLGTRMQAFFQEQLKRPEDRVVVIGTDSPTLPEEYVDDAFEMLNDVQCVIGPATDGGYYLVGMQGSVLPIFEGISWSQPDVLHETVARVEQTDAKLAMLPVWYDVDTAEDLRFLRGHVRALRHAQSPLNLDSVGLMLESLPDEVFSSSENIPAKVGENYGI